VSAGYRVSMPKMSGRSADDRHSYPSLKRSRKRQVALTVHERREPIPDVIHGASTVSNEADGFSGHIGTLIVTNVHATRTA